MSDIATLIDRLELLRDGEPLPGDDEPVHGKFTRGFYRRNDAACRTMHAAISNHAKPVEARLACELCDNLETILTALRYWKDRP